jgi:ABC-type amino acid transport substrate-binding protein
MKLLLASSALAAALAAAPAMAQPPAIATHGQVSVQGAEPSKIAGAIDADKLVRDQAAEGSVQVAVNTQPPQPQTSVTVDTTTHETAAAQVETTTEVITPVSGRPALDAEYPIAPEVKAVVAAKKKYTTADIALAQHDAMMKTPVSEPTTVIVTTTTTPKPG